MSSSSSKTKTGSQYGILTIGTVSNITVWEIADFLESLEAWYTILYDYEDYLSTIRRSKSLEVNRDRFDFLLSNQYKNRETTWYTTTGRNQLQIKSISVKSPGIWKFLGSFGILEFIRGMLHDSHERNKDKNYRNDAERRRLGLENAHKKLGLILRERLIEREAILNAMLQTEKLKQDIELMNSCGLPQSQINELIRQHFLEPSLNLSGSILNGLIEKVEEVKPEEE